MGKIIKLNEGQVKQLLSLMINEEVEGNIVSSVADYLVKGILGPEKSEKRLYDTNAPEVFEKEPTMVIVVGNYVITLLGSVDKMPYVTPVDNGDYYTPSSGGDIVWKPKVFYPKSVYDITQNKTQMDEEYFEAISEELIEKVKEIPIDYSKIEIIINGENYGDEYDVDDYEYETKRDDSF